MYNKFALLKCTVDWVSVFSQSCAIIPPSNTFFSPQRNSVPISSSCHISTFPRNFFLTKTNLLSVFMNLPILGVLHKWNHTVFNLLCLASFIWHKAYKVRPSGNMCQDFISSCASVGFRPTNIPHSVSALFS